MQCLLADHTPVPKLQDDFDHSVADQAFTARIPTARPHNRTLPIVAIVRPESSPQTSRLMTSPDGVSELGFVEEAPLL
ncbi:MAG: hypothetical protein A2W31_13390 [Planctomycetes bacterium RBG_16_64_10]|nr:MAG: hypothetical protein A2W31_13390 [Planctomycetes bacterium RBG_16_64_10]